MSIFSEHADALEEIESECGDTITWNSTSYPIIPNSKSVGGRLATGGVEISFDFSCTVRRSLFTDANGAATLPKMGQTIVHGSDTLRIVSVIDAPGGSHIRLLCESNRRGI
jgi:hypothetical protein